MRFMNKKADVSVTILVFMILFLTGFTLSSFAKSNLTSVARFNDGRFVEKANYWEEGVRFDLVEAGERAFTKSYSELISDNPFVKTEEQREEYVKNRVLVNSFGNKFEVEFNGEMLELKSSATFSDSFNVEEEHMTLIYVYSFDKKFYLRDYGLYSVDKIKGESERCQKEEDNAKILNCLNIGLPDLIPSISGDNKITFNSKRKYLIDGSLKQISFVF